MVAENFFSRRILPLIAFGWLLIDAFAFETEAARYRGYHHEGPAGVASGLEGFGATLLSAFSCGLAILVILSFTLIGTAKRSVQAAGFVLQFMTMLGISLMVVFLVCALDLAKADVWFIMKVFGGPALLLWFSFFHPVLKRIRSLIQR